MRRTAHTHTHTHRRKGESEAEAVLGYMIKRLIFHILGNAPIH